MPHIAYNLTTENVIWGLSVYHPGSAQKCPPSLTDSGPSSDALKQNPHIKKIPGAWYIRILEMLIYMISCSCGETGKENVETMR